MNKLIFLGTGNANNLKRQLTSLLFVTEKKNFLIDCGDGMGTVRQIVKSGIDPHSISDVFLTHHHADHVLGLIHFLYIRLRNDKDAKIRVFGTPKALRAIKTIGYLTHDAIKQNAHRIALITLKNHSRIIVKPGLIVQTGVVKGPLKVQTFAYKVQMKLKTIVFSSDMHPSVQFDRFAKGADILVHECFCLNADKPEGKGFGHSTAREAGECAQKAKVKQLILTHLPESNTLGLVNEARQYFSGDVRTAEDLMSIKLM